MYYLKVIKIEKFKYKMLFQVLMTKYEVRIKIRKGVRDEDIKKIIGNIKKDIRRNACPPNYQGKIVVHKENNEIVFEFEDSGDEIGKAALERYFSMFLKHHYEKKVISARVGVKKEPEQPQKNLEDKVSDLKEELAKERKRTIKLGMKVGDLEGRLRRKEEEIEKKTRYKIPKKTRILRYGIASLYMNIRGALISAQSGNAEDTFMYLLRANEDIDKIEKILGK